ncbi:hypothetical protein [Rhodoferax sp.]|uniref:hypothetical protein n=1 Tax=Rhodoferax sp. TaxID=50421 RepID=UPI0025FB345E|nr:hypothetical protein [Rhodoferax sp.]
MDFPFFSSVSSLMEYGFWLLIAFSVLAPVGVFATLLVRRVISRPAVLVFGIVLILLAGLDVVLLQKLNSWAKVVPTPLEDHFFASEVSLALYLLPVVLAGIGVNLVSHVLIHHLGEAERRFDKSHKNPE